MPTVALVSRKVVAAKSTLATNIAAHFARGGLPVTLGDLDHQQSMRLAETSPQCSTGHRRLGRRWRATYGHWVFRIWCSIPPAARTAWRWPRWRWWPMPSRSRCRVRCLTGKPHRTVGRAACAPARSEWSLSGCRNWHAGWIAGRKPKKSLATGRHRSGLPGCAVCAARTYARGRERSQHL